MKQDRESMKRTRQAHPYIPNSVPETREQMLREIGVGDVEQLYSEMIPARLRLKRPMRMPEALRSELELRRHVEAILSRNRTCAQYTSFLGGGCWQHFVPAVCDEISRRSEFLTAYSGEYSSDLGRFQSFFEFQSMIGELVGMEVACLSTYDWGAAAGNAVRMASRINGRREILVAGAIGPSRLSIIRNFAQHHLMLGRLDIIPVAYDPRTGAVDLDDMKEKVSDRTAAVYFENPSYLGVIETRGDEISRLAHEHGAECIVGADPISLGVLAPPSDYGADIVCGDIQPLGVHMNCGGGLGGFIASRDEEKYVSEYPTHLISIAGTEREGEHGFGYCRYDRTSYIAREKAKDWVGTGTALWAIVAANYMALMGPEGMREVGEAIIQKSHYAAQQLSKVKGVKVKFPSFFKEFVVNFDGTRKSVGKINKALLKAGIFGGLDLSRSFPELGQSALYSVTEVTRKESIDRLAKVLKEAVR